MWHYAIENMKFQRLSQCIGKDLRREFMVKYASWDTKHKANFQCIMVSAKFLILNKQIKPVIHSCNNCSEVILCLFAVDEIEVTQLESPICNILFSAIEFVCGLWKYCALFDHVFTLLWFTLYYLTPAAHCFSIWWTQISDT